MALIPKQLQELVFDKEKISKSKIRFLKLFGYKWIVLILNFTALFADQNSLHLSIVDKSKQMQDQNGVSYLFSGGRLGDNLVAYFHGKWIAYKYHLPFFYRPFPLSELFELSQRDTKVNDVVFENSVYVDCEEAIDLSSFSTLYEIPYSPECRFEYQREFSKCLPYIDVDWNDEVFHREVIECLKPRCQVTPLKLPKNAITVAVHVRRGGGIDDFFASMHRWPLKFPPESFYIDQLKKMGKLFKKKRLYVYLFTDDLNPSEIAKRFQKACRNKKMTIAYREVGNHPNANILDDFYAMTQFDCLIRSQSNFSLIASKIGNYKVLIYPTHAIGKEGVIVIDQVEVEIKS